MTAAHNSPRPDTPLEAPEADLVEQLTPAEGDRPLDPSPLPRVGGDLSPEVPEADVLEELTPVDPDEPLYEPDFPDATSMAEADPADVAEQSIPVRVEDDDEDQLT
jgi:hypothetical protein